jgi:hypothetical protein
MTKDTFFSTAKKTKAVEIDGASYTIRKLSQGEVERMKREFSTDDKALAGFRFVVTAVVLDEQGGQMFEQGDATKLTEIDYDVIEGIATAAMEFSGLIKQPKKS